MRLHSSVLLLGLIATACQSRSAPPPASVLPPPPPSVTIQAFDYGFDAPEQIPSGVTTFHLINRGPGLHHALFVRLDSNKTAADLVAALEKQTGVPAWATFVGGPNVPDPGKESVATLNLAPGNYALICILDMPGNVPHYKKGMFRPMTVTPAPAATAAKPAAVLPTADNAIQLSDMVFQLAMPITAGTHHIQVVTAPGQAHEVLVVQLEPGKTGHDYLDWTATLKGLAPGHAVGGTAAATSGIEQVFTATFVKGHYVLLCFAPDMKTGKPHAMEGHMREIKVE